MVNTSYVVGFLAASLAVLAPRLSAIEQRAVSEESLSQDRVRFTRQAERELEELERSIDGLRAVAKEKGRAGRVELERQAERLDRRRERAQRRLTDLKASSGERWRQFRGHVSDLLEDLREDVRTISEDEEEAERPTRLP